MLRAGKADLPHIWGWLSPEEGKVAQADQPRDGRSRPTRSSARASSTCARTSRRSTTCGCGAPCRWPSTARRGTTRCSSARAASTPARCRARSRTGSCDAAKIDPAKAQVPRSATIRRRPRRLLAEAGFAEGLHHADLPLAGLRRRPGGATTSWPPTTSARSAITAELKPEEYGKYISTTALGKYEKMAMGPSTPVHRGRRLPLRRASTPSCPHNQSHVADAELTKMLVAQRREMDPEEAQADRRRHPALPGRQGVLRLRAEVAAVHRAPAAGEGLQAPRRLRARHRLMYTWLER